MSDDFRWSLFMYATKVKGVKCGGPGITPAMGNMIKSGKRRVSDAVPERLLARLTAGDLLEALGGLKALKPIEPNNRGPSSSWLVAAP